MKLNVLERIMALQTIALYAEGNFITFKTLNSLRMKLGFNEDENKKYEIKEENNMYIWNELGSVEEVDIPVTDGELILLVNKLLELDKNSKLTPNHFSLYEKVVVIKTDDEL